MKHILLFSILLLQTAAFSQEKTEAPRPRIKFSMEVMGGLTLNRMPTDYSPYNPGCLIGTSSQSGFYAGVAGRAALSPKWAFRLETQFAKKGYSHSSFNGPPQYLFDYVDVIPQVEYQIIPNLSASLGGYAGFRGAARSKFNNRDWEEMDKESVGIVRNDFGLVAGLTGHLGRFRAYARYQHGLSDINNTIEYPFLMDVPMETIQYSRSFQLGVGYRIL